MNKGVLGVIGAAIIVVLLGGGWMAYQASQYEEIYTFEQCVKAGHPVMESYPRKCASPTGTFTETGVGATNPTTKDDLIRVYIPAANALIKSPLVIEGEARGKWYFEASFPVRVLDANGKELGVVPAQAQGEWMTNDYVPFKASLIFSPPSTDTGTVVFQKDNPSGLLEHDNALAIPIRFDRSQVSERTVKLYYYSAAKDKDANGNVQCSDRGLIPLNRTMSLTQSPIQDAIKLLIKGELSTSERAQGITTEFPLSGFALSKAVLTNGNLELTFVDPQNKTSGGSCRVSILRAQIESTAKQFSGVNSVTIFPGAILQP